jgi:AbrB family looped-hinge helix DNA binding protein
MAVIRVSNRGQITIPAAARRKLGIKPESRLEIEVRDAEIVIRPLKSIGELFGVFSEYAKGKTTDWEIIRAETAKAIAEEVVNKDRR